MRDFIGETFGNYKLIKSLGEGSFGKVYLGENIHMSTIKAAVKVLTKSTTTDKERFLHEARILNGFNNIHIIRMKDFGVYREENGMHEEWPFIVMDYAPLRSLREYYPLGSRLPIETIVKYVEQIADGLQYAHEQDIIHRDVKPENILVGEGDHLLLSDFGLARNMPEPGNRASNAGTPLYMAPEQIEGNPCPNSDQYALAVMVYEWICGEPPFTQGNLLQIKNQHMRYTVPFLREKTSSITELVERVVMRALVKKPEDRFSSVKEFSDKLSNAYSHYKRDIYNESVSLRKVGEEITSYRGHTSRIRAVAWSPNGKYIASGGHDSVVHIWDASSGELRNTSQNTENLILSIAWSPDGSQIVFGQQDGTVQMHSLAEQTTYLFTHADQMSDSVRDNTSVSVRSVTWSPNGQYIASASDDKTVLVWDIRRRQLLHIYKRHSDEVKAIAWSPDGQYIASASDDKTVHIWEASTGTLLCVCEGHISGVRAVAWSSDSTYVVSGSLDTTVRVWKVDGTHVFTYKGHKGYVNTVSWSPDGQYIASGSDDGTVRVLNAVTGVQEDVQEYIYQRHKEAVNAVAWSSDSTCIVSGASNRTRANDDRTIFVWQAVAMLPIPDRITQRLSPQI